jgi:hypothetical protein
MNRVTTDNSWPEGEQLPCKVRNKLYTLDGLMLVVLRWRTAVGLLGRVERRRIGVIYTHVQRDPLAGGTRCSLLKHAVDLFERKAFGFRDEKVSEEHARGAGSAPDEEDLRLQVAVILINHVRGYEADDKIPEPLLFMSASFHRYWIVGLRC